jgi:hypothetical protein
LSCDNEKKIGMNGVSMDVMVVSTLTLSARISIVPQFVVKSAETIRRVTETALIQKNMTVSKIIE